MSRQLNLKDFGDRYQHAIQALQNIPDFSRAIHTDAGREQLVGFLQEAGLQGQTLATAVGDITRLYQMG